MPDFTADPLFGNHAIELRKGEHCLRRLLSDLLTGESCLCILERLRATLSSVCRPRTERCTEERTAAKTAQGGRHVNLYHQGIANSIRHCSSVSSIGRQ
jgi:hypothetical protein